MHQDLKPTQKPICFNVQQLLYQYKSNKENDKKECNYQELFETINSKNNNSFDSPKQGQETTQASIQESQIETKENIQEVKETIRANDVILLTTQTKSVFKYLQENSQLDKLNKQEIKKDTFSQNRLNNKSKSPSPFRVHRENVIPRVQKKTSHTPLKQQKQTHVMVDFTKYPSQRVIVKKQNENRIIMKVGLSLKNLVQGQV